MAGLVVSNAAFTHVETRRLYESGGAVAAAYDRRAAAARLLTLVRDAETGQRGFLLTGQDRYLEPYVQAREALASTLEELRGVPSLGAVEDVLVTRMKAAIARRMADLENGLRVRREQGLEAARAEILDDRGREAMLDLREAAGAIRELETGELERRAEQNRARYRSMQLSRLLVTGCGLLLLYGTYRLAERGARQRSRSLALSQEQAERFRVTLRSIGDGVIVTDAQGRVRFMNPVAERLTGWQEGWDGLPVADVFRVQEEESGRPRRDPVARVLKEKRAVSFEAATDLVARDGSVLPIDDSAAPIVDADGALAGVVLVFRDVAARRRAERAARERKEALEEEERRKDELLAVLAHELRNPLGALRNASEVLRLVEAGSAESHAARDIIERQVRAMTRTVDELGA